ncbi:MAG: 5-oxoprolinase subunit PxpA [Microbacterium sp.]|uniref:LamB/YcsF family protein n=1 Tax=Microbacterium sp. TaxID=51671 RepID=UPI0039E4AF77
MSEQLVVELNCDMGEGYGRWKFAPDEELMPYISTANIACGFHAGDPRIMRDTVRNAVRLGLQIGAHVALPDIIGFGRRRIAITPEEMRDNTVYQIGAIKAFVESEGGTLAHVKPHGVMYVMAQDDPALGEAVVQAVADVDKSMLLYALNDKNAPIATSYGVTLVPEGFVDLHYDREGNLLIERVKQAWDPHLVADRAIRLVREGVVAANDGADVSVNGQTICLHGDAPNSVEVLRTVRARLEEDGIRVAPLVPPKS